MYWLIWTPYNQYLSSKVYFTEEEAITAASSEAVKNPGLKYYIFQAIAALELVGGEIEQTTMGL
jgi:hypothetical protein